AVCSGFRARSERWYRFLPLLSGVLVGSLVVSDRCAVEPVDVSPPREEAPGGAGEEDLPGPCRGLAEVVDHGLAFGHEALVPGRRGLGMVDREVAHPLDLEPVLLQRSHVLPETEPVESRPDVLLVEGDAHIEVD